MSGGWGADVVSGPPVLPEEFWAVAPMREAFAARHIGRVIRAYRTHPWHGRRAVSQEAVAEWLGTTQPRLSRIENGSRIEQLDLLIHWASVLGVPQRHLWFALPGGLVGQDANGPDLGAPSRARSTALLVPLAAVTGPAYVPHLDAVGTLREFVGSPSRVFLLTGPPGVGKTTLGFRLVEHLADVADIQIHPVGDWADHDHGLQTEILRYAGQIDDGITAPSLERSCATLARPCLVVVDGVATQDEMNRVAAAIDRVLRQVLTHRLRFVVLARNPPVFDVAAAPLFAATLHGDRLRPGSSFRMRPWSPAQATQAWDSSPTMPGRFAELPAAVQHLARSPLHMRLLAVAGANAVTSSSAFELVRSFVRAALRGSADGVWETLVRAAMRQRPGVRAVWLTLGASGGDVTTAELLPVLYDAENKTTFVHDVVGEYVAAVDLAERIRARGRSAAALRALSRLTDAAGESASALGVFEFVVRALDLSAPEILAAAAVAPAIDRRTTLPLLLELAARDRLSFLTSDVVVNCARRCARDGTVELARALLTVRMLPDVLGVEYPAWTNVVLRSFGSAVWPDVVRAVEGVLDVHGAHAMLHDADLAVPIEAVFFARHFFLFLGADADPTGPFADLLGHLDWRVRAALAEGLPDAGGTGPIRRIAETLAADPDYKVRAAVARSLGAVPPDTRHDLLARLLVDDSWHVRGCALLGLTATAPTSSELTATLNGILTTDVWWQKPPAHVAPVLAQIAMWLGVPAPLEGLPDRAVDQAVFRLLREMRTGWAPLPDGVRSIVLGRARESTGWVVRREAAAVEHGRAATISREGFRRLRGRRILQVALDLQDVGQAAAVASAAAAAGADFVEVGDPLIKRAGLVAVTDIKRAIPDTVVVAEMMSADWGRDQVELAAEAGADVVLLIGLASPTSVAAAVGAGHRLGVPVMLDTPPGPLDQRWVRDMERHGVDAFVVTTNIDHGLRGSHPLDRTRMLRGWTKLPVAVSGGFGPQDRDVLSDTGWDIAILGRSVAEAVDPAIVTRQVLHLARPTDRKSS